MKPEILLADQGLSKTKTRVKILHLLMRSDLPLSGKDICNGLTSKCDKSTVYRTLNSLYEKDLLQRVIIDYEVKYTLRDKHHASSTPEPDHVHFKCMNCEKVMCMTDLLVKDYALPEGFVKKENQFLIIGTCKECQ